MENFISKMVGFIIGSMLSACFGFADIQNIDDFNQIIKSYDTLSADFTQEKRIDLLDSIIIVKGELKIKKPGLLRWQMNSPVKQIIVIDNSFVSIKDEGMKVKKYSLTSTPFMKDMLKVFINILQNDWDKLHTFFQSSFSQKKSMITLIPKQKLFKASIKEILIFIDNDNNYIKWLKMIEQNGDYSKTIFNNIIFNKKLDDESFQLL